MGMVWLILGVVVVLLLVGVIAFAMTAQRRKQGPRHRTGPRTVAELVQQRKGAEVAKPEPAPAVAVTPAEPDAPSVAPAVVPPPVAARATTPLPAAPVIPAQATTAADPDQPAAAPAQVAGSDTPWGRAARMTVAGEPPRPGWPTAHSPAVEAETETETARSGSGRTLVGMGIAGAALAAVGLTRKSKPERPTDAGDPAAPALPAQVPAPRTDTPAPAGPRNLPEPADPSTDTTSTVVEDSTVATFTDEGHSSAEPGAPADADVPVVRGESPGAGPGAPVDADGRYSSAEAAVPDDSAGVVERPAGAEGGQPIEAAGGGDAVDVVDDEPRSANEVGVVAGAVGLVGLGAVAAHGLPEDSVPAGSIDGAGADERHGSADPAAPDDADVPFGGGADDAAEHSERIEWHSSAAPSPADDAVVPLESADSVVAGDDEPVEVGGTDASDDSTAPLADEPDRDEPAERGDLAEVDAGDVPVPVAEVPVVEVPVAEPSNGLGAAAAGVGLGLLAGAGAVAAGRPVGQEHDEALAATTAEQPSRHRRDTEPEQQEPVIDDDVADVVEAPAIPAPQPVDGENEPPAMRTGTRPAVAASRVNGIGSVREAVFAHWAKAAEPGTVDVALLRSFGIADTGGRPEAAPVVSLAAPGAHEHAVPHSGPQVPVAVHVVNRDGAGVLHAAVTLVDDDGEECASGGTDPDGRASLTAPGGGAYVVVASAPGHQPGAVGVLVGADPVAAELLLVGSSAVAGSVWGDDGAIAGAQLTLVQDGDVVGSSETGADGGYRVPDLAAGSYGLSVTAPGCTPVAMVVAIADGMVVRYDIDMEPAGR